MRDDSSTHAGCARCGTPLPGHADGGDDRESAAVGGWMLERDTDRGPSWVCPTCVRSHMRAIEARLDHQWW